MALKTDGWGKRVPFYRVALVLVFLAALGGLIWERRAHERADSVYQFLNVLRADHSVRPTRQAFTAKLLEKFGLVLQPGTAPDQEILSWQGILFRYDVNLFYHEHPARIYTSFDSNFRLAGSPEGYAIILMAAAGLLLAVWLARRLGNHPVPFEGASGMNDGVMHERPAPISWWLMAQVIAAYCGLYVLFFSPVLFSGRLLACGDNADDILPFFSNPWSVWEPLLACGYPRLGDPQCWTWYAPARFFSFLGWWNGLVLTGYVLASTFAFGLVRRLTGSSLAGFAAGIIYGMSGFMMAHERHMDKVHAAAYLPLLIWALEELRHRISGKWLTILAVAAAGTLLGGHPQIFVLAMATAGLFAAFACWSAPAGTIRFGMAAGVGLALGIGLTAVQLLPTLELAPLSRRSAISYEQFASDRLPINQLPMLLFPFGYGEFWYPGSVDFQMYLGRPTCIEEPTGYCGYLALLLAGLGVAARRRGGCTAFWLLLGLFNLCAAMGKDTSISDLMYLTPGFNKFRCPGRHLLVTTLAVTVLAGYGLAWLQEQVHRRSTRRLVTASALIAALVLVSWLTLAWQMQHSAIFGKFRGADSAIGSPLPWINGAIGLQLVNLLLGLGALWIWHLRRTRLAAAVLIAALTLDLGVFGWLTEWHRHPVTSEEVELPRFMVPVAERLAGTHERMLFFARNHSVTANWKVENAYGDAQLNLRRNTQLMQEGIFATLIPDVLAVRFALVDPAWKNPNDGHWKVFRQAEKVNSVWIESAALRLDCVLFENQRPAPRVRLVSQVLALDDADVLRTLWTGRLPDGSPLNPLRTALVEDPAFSMEGMTDPAADAQIVESVSTRVKVRTHCTYEAFLALANAHYPGWIATVDGEPAPIAITNYVLQGVQVPSGDHEVVFEFRSRTLLLGMVITLGSSVIILLLWICGRRRKNDSMPATR